jgi:hypothetical protein
VGEGGGLLPFRSSPPHRIAPPPPHRAPTATTAPRPHRTAVRSDQAHRTAQVLILILIALSVPEPYAVEFTNQRNIYWRKGLLSEQS